MDILPIIDWNGNGTVDPEDIAIALAVAEEEVECDDEQDD